MQPNEATLIAMVESNARSMTDKFLRHSWNVAYTHSMERPTADQRATWAAIRDVYGAEIDRRDLAPRDAREYAARRLAD